MGVLALWRYPVKAMLGELLEAVEIGPGGCDGDRRWLVVDADTGERIQPARSDRSAATGLPRRAAGDRRRGAAPARHAP